MIKQYKKGKHEFATEIQMEDLGEFSHELCALFNAIVSKEELFDCVGAEFLELKDRFPDSYHKYHEIMLVIQLADMRNNGKLDEILQEIHDIFDDLSESENEGKMS